MRGAVHLLAAFALLAAPAASFGATTTFTGSEVPFPNPERGFYRAGQGSLDRFDPAFLADAFQDGYRLIYARIDLSPYRDRALPPAFLDRLGAGFAAARVAGVKLIVRAVYNYPHGETDYRGAQDAPLPIVLRHIAQLGPVLRANEDAIAFVQAGFVGAWGEWHSSSNRLAEPAARTKIKDALLRAVPADRFVQFRYPPYVREWMPLPVARARIGFHNDCFLASRTDVGTFSEEAGPRAAEQDYIDRIGDVAPFGGETCNPADDPGAQPRTECSDILREGARYNLSYLNADYYRPLFHTSWIAGGCMDEVSARMGYRLRLIGLTHADRAVPGGRLALRLTLRNDGWARLYNPRALVILLRDLWTAASVPLPASAVDLTTLRPGKTEVVSLNLSMPRRVAPGRYMVSIAFPDPSARLADDPRFAIRPANGDDAARGQRWDADAGAFETGTEIRVQSTR